MVGPLQPLQSLRLLILRRRVLDICKRLLLTRAVVVKLQSYSHLLEEGFKFLIERLPLEPFVAQFEQKTQVGLVMVRLETVFRKHRIVRGEDGAEGETFNVGLLLGAQHDLVEDGDICSKSTAIQSRQEEQALYLRTLVSETCVLVIRDFMFRWRRRWRHRRFGALRRVLRGMNAGSQAEHCKVTSVIIGKSDGL